VSSSKAIATNAAAANTTLRSGSAAQMLGKMMVLRRIAQKQIEAVSFGEEKPKGAGMTSRLVAEPPPATSCTSDNSSEERSSERKRNRCVRRREEVAGGKFVATHGPDWSTWTSQV